MSSIDFSVYPKGTVLQVVCRDGKTREVTTGLETKDGTTYPNCIKDLGQASHRNTLTNSGKVYASCTSNQDVCSILQDRSRPVARGFRRQDSLPGSEHGSIRWGQILWRDSRDNELRLFDHGTLPASNFDEWFPLAQFDFQVEIVSESVKAHKEAVKAYGRASGGGSMEVFVKGYLSAKGVSFSREDYAIARR